MAIICQINSPISPEQYVQLVTKCQVELPTPSHYLIKGMLDDTNLLVSAWSQEGNDAHELVGIARCNSDFSHSCRIAELLVRPEFQSQDVAELLIKTIETQLTPSCLMMVMTKNLPDTTFKKLGFENHNQTWVKLAD